MTSKAKKLVEEAHQNGSETTLSLDDLNIHELSEIPNLCIETHWTPK